MGASSASVTTEAPASEKVAVPARGLESAAQRVWRRAPFLPAVLLVLAAVALWMIALDSVQLRRSCRTPPSSLCSLSGSGFAGSS